MYCGQEADPDCAGADCRDGVVACGRGAAGLHRGSIALHSAKHSWSEADGAQSQQLSPTCWTAFSRSRLLPVAAGPATAGRDWSTAAISTPITPRHRVLLRSIDCSLYADRRKREAPEGRVWRSLPRQLAGLDDPVHQPMGPPVNEAATPYGRPADQPAAHAIERVGGVNQQPGGNASSAVTPHDPARFEDLGESSTTRLGIGVDANLGERGMIVEAITRRGRRRRDGGRDRRRR